MDRPGFDPKADLYIATVVVAGVAALGSSLRHIMAGGLDAQHLAWIGIAVLTILVGRLTIRLPFPNCRVSFSDALIFLSVLVFGGDFGTLTAALDGFASSPRQKGALHKTAFNTAGMAVSVRLSAWLFERLLPDAASISRPSSLQLLLPVAALALSQYLLNTLLVSTAVTLKDHASFFAIWRNASPWAGVAYLTGSLAAAAVFVAVRDLGVLLTLTVLPIPVIVHFTFRAVLGQLTHQRVTVPGSVNHPDAVRRTPPWHP
jgi:hypothetical protein